MQEGDQWKVGVDVSEIQVERSICSSYERNHFIIKKIKFIKLLPSRERFLIGEQILPPGDICQISGDVFDGYILREKNTTTGIYWVGGRGQCKTSCTAQDSSPQKSVSRAKVESLLWRAMLGQLGKDSSHTFIFIYL